MRSRARLRWVLGVVVACAGAAQAGAPRVVRSSPADGAKDVSVGIGRVVVEFDQPMSQEGWTLATAGALAYPPDVPDGASWASATTFVLRIGRLKPGTTYGVQLNLPQRQRFASAAGLPLPVTRITFTTAAEGAARGYRIVNALDDFIRYYDACKGAGAAERAARWDILLEAKHKDFFDQSIYRRKTGADRERYKQGCIRRFWSDVAPNMATLRKLAPGVPGQIHEVVRAFKGKFPDFRPSTDFFITISLSYRGKVMDVNEKQVMGIGMEYFKTAGPQLRITIAHELLHLYHYQFFSKGRGLYRWLWTEGMAVYGSAVIIPGHRGSAYLGFPGAKMDRCHAMLPLLARELKRKLVNTGRRTRRIFFGAEDNDTQIPPEAGYYVGYLIVAKLAKSHPMAKLARLKDSEVLPILRRELDLLAAGK